MPAAATEPAWPSQETIDRVRQAHPFPDARAIERAPISRPPRITSGAAGTDIEAIVRQHAKLGEPSREQAAQQPTLRVFVTLNMPAASLKGLVDQAARSGATLVLRGLKEQSMRKTVAAVHELIGERRVGWQIDPEAFTRFGVERVPTFVLLTGGAGRAPDSTCTADCPLASSFVAIAGDVSIDYALQSMVRQVPSAKPHAEPFLTRLKDSR